MKRAILLLTCLILVVSCAPKPETPERFVEDGVEVVLNRLEPYEIKGEPSTFTLEREFAIDTERDEIAELGLTDINLHFDVDSAGNIYLACHKNADGMIFRFDREGNFVRSFLRKGQGPGELRGRNYGSLYITVDENDNIAISDFGNKLVVFGSEGELINENRIDSRTVCTVPLPNGNFLSYISILDGTGDFINQNPLTLLDDQFEAIKELDKQMVPNPIVGKRLKGSYHILSWSVSNSKIFSGFQERGYEIHVFDFDGNLVRKIKKEFHPVPVPEEYKKTFMEQFSAPIYDDIRNKIYFPDALPPFHAIFADDGDRLFVMTFEEGLNPGEFMYDIFDPDGVCTGRKSLNVYHDEVGIYAKMKDGRFYCLTEKDSGYKELVVSKVLWEQKKGKAGHAPSPEEYPDENIEIVKNSSEGLWGEDKHLKLEEELIIGKEYGDEKEMFRYLRGIAFDAEDNLYVNDSYELVIKIYDNQGKFIKSFGREGGGPGEFKTIDDIHYCSYDNLLYIADRMNNRIAQFSTDGTFLKAFKTSKFKARVEKISSFDDGNFVLTARRYGGNFADYRIMVVDHTFENVIAELKEDFPIHSLGMEMIPGFSDVGVISGMDLYYSSPSAYKIVLFDKNLAKYKIIQKSHPKMFSPQYVHGFYSDFNAIENLSMVNGKYIVGVSFTQTKDIPLFEQKLDLVNFVDKERRSGYQLDIFNSDFQFLKSVAVPAERRLAGIDSKGRLYFIENEPFPRIIRCAIELDL
jgi:hypothetical protein